MGLAIDGNVVHGIAVAGNAFVSAENSMPNLVGQAIDFSKVPKDGTHTISCFGWFGTQFTEKSGMSDCFVPLSNPHSADQWNTVNTIYGETVLPANTSVAQDTPQYRAKSELFLYVFWTTVHADLSISDITDWPIYVWIKYNDVKDYIRPSVS